MGRVGRLGLDPVVVERRSIPDVDEGRSVRERGAGEPDEGLDEREACPGLDVHHRVGMGDERGVELRRGDVDDVDGRLHRDVSRDSNRCPAGADRPAERGEAIEPIWTHQRHLRLGSRIAERDDRDAVLGLGAGGAGGEDAVDEHEAGTSVVAGHEIDLSGVERDRSSRGDRRARQLQQLVDRGVPPRFVSSSGKRVGGQPFERGLAGIAAPDRLIQVLPKRQLERAERRAGHATGAATGVAGP